jgi:hypothetical protein
MESVQEGLNIYLNKTRHEGLKMTSDYLPNHFLMAICGKPGSGKTLFLNNILTDPTLLWKKFDYVFIISPSPQEFNNLFLPKDNFNKNLDWKWISSKISKINTNLYCNVLFVFDDVISKLYESRNGSDIMDFIFNRRHLLNNGMVSIIITSQKFTRIQTEIRSCISVLVFFKLNNLCLKKIYEDLIFLDRDKYDEVCMKVLQNPHDFLLYRLDTNFLYKNSILIKNENGK